MHLNISGQCFEARSLSQIEKVLFRLHLLRRTYWQLIAAAEKRLILLEGVSTGRIGSTCMHILVEWSFLFCFFKKNKCSLEQKGCKGLRGVMERK